MTFTGYIYCQKCNIPQFKCEIEKEEIEKTKHVMITCDSCFEQIIKYEVTHALQMRDLT